MRKFVFFEGKINDESNPRYYDVDGFEFVGVTPPLYSPITFTPRKCMLFRNLETDEIVKANFINEDHPMWDYCE